MPLPDELDRADDVDDPTAEDSLALRRPDVPVTLAELAARKGEAIEIIEARVQVLATVRKAAIRSTSPEDWVLFKSKDGRIVAYLQDAGCDRIRDLFGIEVYNVGKPDKVLGQAPGEFFYLISGDGRCSLTRQVVEQIEGGRSSLDDVCRGKSGADLELTVRKNARANLDGNVTRELAGLKSVAVDELAAGWVGTSKKVEHCRQGRGFGTQAERLGAEVRTKDQPTGEAPKCSACGAAMEFRAAGVSDAGKAYDAFWSCPKRRDHPGANTTVKDADWQQQRGTAAKPAPTTAPAAASAPTGDEIFGAKGKPAGAREPGQEG
jgi:hypothetical protein